MAKLPYSKDTGHSARFTASRPILGRTSTHLYILPHAALRPYIAHYTLTWPGGEDCPAMLRLVPDASGCIVCARRVGGPDVLRFWGPTSRCVDVDNNVSRAPSRVFVEFRPCGAHTLLLGLPLSELRDKRLPLDAVDAPLAHALRRVLELCPAPALPDSLDALFLVRLERAVPSPLTDEILHTLRLTGGEARMADLVRRTGYSERHLRRVCGEKLGLSPKAFARVLRVNRACGLLRDGRPNLALLAQELGYYDQAHFIHDFRMVCGVSPSVYSRNTAVFYKEKFK